MTKSHGEGGEQGRTAGVIPNFIKYGEKTDEVAKGVTGRRVAAD